MMRATGDGRLGRLRRKLAIALAISMVPVTAALWQPAKAAASLDTTFSGDGIAEVTVPGGSFEPWDQTIQPDGKIVVVGGNRNASNQDTVMVRLLSDGSLDSTFGAGGILTVDLGSGQRDIGVSVAIANDGKIVVGGNRYDYPNFMGYVARFNSDGSGPTLNREFGLPPTSTGGTAYTLGGHVALLDGPTGSQQMLLGVWNESPRISVFRLDSNGDPVTTWGTGGIAVADFGVRAVIQDIELSTDQSTFEVSGHIRTGTDDPGVARFHTATGALDLTFSGDGKFVQDFAGGYNDHATAIKIDSSGRTVVVSNSFSYNDPARVFRLDANGNLDLSFNDGGVYTLSVDASAPTRANDVTFDSQERPVIAVTTESYSNFTFGVTRLTTNGSRDWSFADGQEILYGGDCAGTTRSLDIQPDGKYVLMGSCSGNVRVARFQTEVVQPAVTNLELSVTPSGSIPARSLSLDLHSVSPEDRAQLLQTPEALAAIQSSPLRSSPLRSSPLRSSPLRSSPLRSSPLRSSPLRSSPLRSSEMGPILLSTIPLLLPGGWSAILSDPARVDPAILNLPPQAVLLSQLSDQAIEGITLGDIDLSATPLRSSSLSAVLLGASPLSAFPAPSGDWCPALVGQPVSCSSSPSALTRSLFFLEAAGDDLAQVLSQEIRLTGSSLDPASPLAHIPLQGIELSDTPIGGLNAGQVPSLFDCGAVCPSDLTLTDAQLDDGDANAVSDGATVGSLLALSLPGFQLTLGQLLVGLVPVADIPYEDIPLDALLRLAPQDDAVYQAGFDVYCDASSGVTVELDLPEGFSPVPGTAFQSSGGVEPWVQTLDDPAENEGNSYTLSLDPEQQCSGTGEYGHLEVGVHVSVSTSLALTQARAIVRTASTDDSFETEGAELRLYDGADDYEGTRTIESDYLYTGHISTAGQVDLVGFDAPAEGSIVTVQLSHLPADYDLVLYGSDSVASAPLRSSPLRSSPLRSSPLRSSPVGDDGLDSAQGASNVLEPETLQDVPLRSSPLRSSSLQRDASNEIVSTRVTEADQGSLYTIQISGYNGASSPEPYVLRVKVTPPQDDLQCITRNLGTAGVRGTLPGVSAVPAGTETLFLVNQERIGDMYGMHDNGTPADPADDVDWGSQVTSRLTALAAFAGDATGVGAVQGAVLPVDGDEIVRNAYAAWDAEPCSIAAANDVVAAINDVVDAYRANLSSLKHVVLVGSDEALPFARISDLTTLSNQVDYRVTAAPNGFDNPISRAFARGYLLSDDPYGDFDPAEWLDGKLYVPDVALGRLVEKPDEIVGSIERYIESSGKLDTTTSFTAGYDFLSDGAQAVDAALRVKGPAGSPSLINESWTRQQIIEAWNGNGVAASVPKAISVNAHYDHYRALPALGNADPAAAAELLTTADLAGSSLPVGALVFTMGCEGGLNLPDVFAAVGDPRGQDWAQAVARRQGILAGNTGYGYGDTEAVAYSERLYSFFAQSLDGTVSAGQAMALAKQRYVAGLGVAGVYDAKATEEAVFYGLPMYVVGTNGGRAPSFMPVAPEYSATPSVSSTSFDQTFDPTPRLSGRGTYYTVGSQLPQVTHYRPITPRAEVAVPGSPGRRAHGVFLEQITTKDEDNGGAGINPVYSRPTVDLAANEAEPNVKSGIFPTNVVNLTNTATAAGMKDTVVLLPGQFFTDESKNGQGVQRLFKRMAGTVLQSDSSDFVAPTIREVQAGVIDGVGVFDVALTGSDTNRVLALYVDNTTPANPDGSIEWKRLELTNLGGGHWTGATSLAPGATEVTQWLVQAGDTAGNVGTSTNKGRYFNGAQLPPTQQDGVTVSTSQAPRSDGFYDAGVRVTGASDDGETLEVQIDGSPFTTYSGPVTLNDDGLHTVAFRTPSGGSAQILVPVRAQYAEINATVPSPNQEIVVGATVAPVFECTGVGIASCTASANPLDSSPGQHSVTFTARSASGQVLAQVTRQYFARFTFEGFFSPVDNLPTYNSMKAGSTAPTKFRLRKAGGTIESSTSVITVTSGPVICKPANPMDPVEGELTLAMASELKFTGDQFQYNWKTDKSWANTCRRLVFTFTDGTSKQALFAFK